MKARGISAFVLAGSMLVGASSAALAQEGIKDKTVDTTKKAGKATKKAAKKTQSGTDRLHTYIFTT